MGCDDTPILLQVQNTDENTIENTTIPNFSLPTFWINVGLATEQKDVGFYFVLLLLYVVFRKTFSIDIPMQCDSGRAHYGIFY